MADRSSRTPVSALLTSRRAAWVCLGVAVVILVALFGALARAEAPSGIEPAPANAESTRVDEALQRFPDADEQSVLVVASRADGAELSETDLAALKGTLPAIEADTGHEASGPTVSDDGLAALLIAPITVGDDNTATAEVVDALRDVLADHPVAGVEVLVTGGPAFGADVAAAFDGADFTLLAVTIAIVAVLLILTYRSPILWLLPLAVVGAADRLAGLVTAALGQAFDLQFDAGIISVLVFGAGTNYALLLVSRYREELARTPDHRAALASAWRATVPAIVASNVTVVLALLTLTLAAIPGTRGLGVASAAGLLVALLAVLFVLPPLLAVCGRKVFWPFVPSPDAGPRRGGAWRAVAGRVVRRPVVALLAGLAVLGIMAAGLVGTSTGLTQLEKFRVQSESAAGLELLSDHFPPGEAQPIMVVANTEKGEAVADAVSDVDGVVRARVVGESTDGSLSSIRVVGEPAPGTDDALALVDRVRVVAHGVDGAEALVGGAVATELDARAGNDRDLFLIAPLVLAVSFVVLTILLRSLVAPMLLLLVNLTSAVAALGAGAWLSRVLFDQHALDSQVPLLAFLFLVALGIDYTIFLVHRARKEAAGHGTRAGMVEAVSHTGGVITSAGIVLAGVFAALGVLPLVVLGQLGLIVGVGVLVDTLLVRTVVVPAIFGLLGKRMWWPSRVEPSHRSDTAAAHEETPADAVVVSQSAN